MEIVYMNCSRERTRDDSLEPDHGTCDPDTPPPDLGEPDDEYDKDLLPRLYAVCLA